MKQCRLLNTIAMVTSLITLAGCQSNPSQQAIIPAPLPEPVALVESDPAMLQLVSIAQNVHERTAINDQIMTSRYNIKEEARMPVEHLPRDMKRIISFPGGTQLPLETALKEIAKKGNIGYLHPQGTKPLSGIYVIFDGQLRTVAEFVADAARQAGYRADVVFNLTADPMPTVQILYKGAVL